MPECSQLISNIPNDLLKIIFLLEYKYKKPLPFLYCMVRACSFSFWMRVLNDIDRNLLPVKSKGEKRIGRGDLIVSAGEGEVFCLLTQRGFKLGPTLTQLSFDNCRRRRMCFSRANQHFICATVFCMINNHLS